VFEERIPVGQGDPRFAAIVDFPNYLIMNVVIGLSQGSSQEAIGQSRQAHALERSTLPELPEQFIFKSKSSAPHTVLHIMKYMA